ncbi:hypothetical protein MTO96_013591 [Rhipicephalus appendiculatus]
MQGRPFNVQVQNSNRIDAEDGCTFHHNVEQEIDCTSLERDFREETTAYGNAALGVIEQLHSRSGKKRLISKMLLENALFQDGNRRSRVNKKLQRLAGDEDVNENAGSCRAGHGKNA